jgi:hypothetical protein
MPRGNGTGPAGQGPLTGRGKGYCILRLGNSPSKPEGYAGLQGRPVDETNNREDAMPKNNGTGPGGKGPGTGRGRGPCGGGQRKGPAAGAGKGRGRGRGQNAGRGGKGTGRGR